MTISTNLAGDTEVGGGEAQCRLGDRPAELQKNKLKAKVTRDEVRQAPATIGPCESVKDFRIYPKSTDVY